MKKSPVRTASDKTVIAAKQPAGPIAWSYSRLQVYRECPKKFHYKFIEKIVEPQGEAAERGQEIHDLLEFYVRGGGVKFKEQIHTDCLTWLKHTRDLSPIVEEGFAFDAAWKRTQYFAKDVAVRIKMDLFYQLLKAPKKAPHKYAGEFPLAIALDFKTGKIDVEKHEEQLKLYALGGFMVLPDINELMTGVWYVDHEIKPRFMAKFERADVPKLKKYWGGETKKMLTDRTYKPTPSARCSWCYLSAHKGGPCKASTAK